MKTSKEIIGYKLKDEKHNKACRAITGFLSHDYTRPDYVRLSSYGNPSEPTRSYDLLKDAGVLDIWFEPVYKDPERLPVNEWYKDYDGDLFFVEEWKTLTTASKGYGFCRGKWTRRNLHEDGAAYGFTKITKATDAEVEAALIKEAEKRGFNYESEFDALDHAINKTFIPRSRGKVGSDFRLIDGCLFTSGYGLWCIFKNGQWATIIDQPKEEEPHEVIFPKHLEGKLKITFR